MLDESTKTGGRCLFGLADYLLAFGVGLGRFQKLSSWEWLYHTSNWEWMIGIFWSQILLPCVTQRTIFFLFLLDFSELANDGSSSFLQGLKTVEFSS
jgi:uncharacterized membrane protein